jgi:hypothetical protein
MLHIRLLKTFRFVFSNYEKKRKQKRLDEKTFEFVPLRKNLLQFKYQIICYREKKGLWKKQDWYTKSIDIFIPFIGKFLESSIIHFSIVKKWIVLFNSIVISGLDCPGVYLGVLFMPSMDLVLDNFTQTLENLKTNHKKFWNPSRFNFPTESHLEWTFLSNWIEIRRRTYF